MMYKDSENNLVPMKKPTAIKNSSIKVLYNTV